MLFSLILLCSPAACVSSDVTAPAPAQVLSSNADTVAAPLDASQLFSARPEATQPKSRQPALPRVLLDFPYPASPGRTISVGAGDNLQSALNRARRGDEIVLEAGAHFTGNYTLPSLSGSAADGWVVIRGSKSDRLPPLGTRVSPSDALLMPVIITPGTAPAIRFQAGASGWRLVGIEITVTPTLTQQQYGLVFIGENDRRQSTLESVPTDIVLDRMYIHGQPTTNMSRCVALNSARTQVSDSYLTECHGKDFDSQAIWGGNGPGPFKIVNNYLAGAGENIMFGGSDPSIPGLVPSDIEIRNNYIHTPLAWRGTWQRKNLFELKNASRVLIEGNVFDGSWSDAQTGWAIILKSSNQGGDCTWCRTTDVTFRKNLVRNAGAGLNVTGRGDNPNVDTTTRRILISESVFEGIGVAPYGGDRRGFQFLGHSEDIVVERTVLSGSLSAALWLDNRRPAQRLVFRDNVWEHGQYGAITSGRGSGTASLTIGAPGAIWDRMVFVGGQRVSYPVGTGFVTDERDATTSVRVRAVVASATAGVVR